MSQGRSDIPEGVRKALENRIARRIPEARPMVQVEDPDNIDITRGYWFDPGVEPERRGAWRPVDDYQAQMPTNELAPASVEPQTSVHVTGVKPPWNEPPYWSVPFEQILVSDCVPTYEEWYRVGSFTVPDMHVAMLEQMSFEVLTGLVQYELFEFSVRGSGTEVMRIEDMIIDPLVGDPNHRYVFASDVSPMPVRHFFDRGRVITVMVRVRGLVDLAGVSNRLPGDPILPNANFRVLMRGYYAPFRKDVDGGPRQQDLGNMGFYDLDAPYGSDWDREGI